MSKLFLSIGAGPGIGLATARRFASEGYSILLASRNLSGLRSQAASLSDAGVKVDVAQVDASDPFAVAALVQNAGTDLEVLHYNAGVLHYGVNGDLKTRSIDDENTASLVTDTSINITSALAAVQSAMPVMTVRGSGTVLLTGGGLGVQPSGDFLTLSVGKAGIRAAALALFNPLKARGIHIGTVTVSTLVSPGSQEATEIADAFWKLHAQPIDGWTAELAYPTSKT